MPLQAVEVARLALAARTVLVVALQQQEVVELRASVVVQVLFVPEA